MERARLREPNRRRDVGDRTARVLQRLDREVAAQFVLDRLAAVALLAQPTAQRGGRALRIVGPGDVFARLRRSRMAASRISRVAVTVLVLQPV